MNTVGLVLLSVLGGFLLLAFLLGLGLLLWKAFQAARLFDELTALVTAVQAETRAINEQHANRMKAEFDAARSALTTLRAEVRSSWIEETRSIHAALQEHRREIAASIEKINAEALQTAAVRSIEAVGKLEKAVTFLQKMLLEAGERPGQEYGPDEYAPEEEQHGPFRTPASQFTLGAAARLDQEAQAEEAAAVTAEGSSPE